MGLNKIKVNNVTIDLIVQETGQSTSVTMSQKTVTDELNLLNKRPWKHHCATNWYNNTFKLIYSKENHTITVEPDGSGDCYLWYENSSIWIPYSKLTVTLNIADGYHEHYLYAVQDLSSENPAIFLTNRFDNIPDNAVIIDIFYSWGWTSNTNIKAFWTSDFIPHEGFPSNYADACVSYANPKINDMLNIAHKFLYVTYLMNCSISLVRNGTTAVCTISRPGSQGYIYHEYGYFSINSNSIVSELQLLDNINIIYFDYPAQEVKITGNIDDITKTCVVFEIFYAYKASPAYGCWTTPFITKTGFDCQNDVLSLLPLSWKDEVTNSINNLKTNVLYCRATTYFSGGITLTYDSSLGTIRATSANETTYLYYETGHIEIAANIDHTFTITSGTYYICANRQEQDIFITLNYSSLTYYDIILDVLYAWGPSSIKAFWTSDFITHIGFPDNYVDGCVSYANPKKVNDLQSRVSVLENTASSIKRAFPYSVKAFRRVGCIGDSYTKGYIYPSGGSVTEDENYSWPHFMETITGNKYSNWGVSGSTAKGWMSGAAKLAQVQASGNKCQAYIVGLMINDRSRASWNRYYTPVGVITDIGTDNDTYYAWYYKLIQAVIVVNSDAPIFCNTCPIYGQSDAYNQAVRDIVEYCHNNSQKVYLNDLTDSKYIGLFSDPIFTADSVNGHYTAIGYEYMAECLKEIISDTINSNISEFQNIHLIPFDNA